MSKNSKQKLSSFEVKDILQSNKVEIARNYHVNFLGLFGSVVRDEADETSDVDILVDFEEVPGLLHFIELENYISDLLGMKVDLVMRNTLKPIIGERILREVVPI